MSSVPLRKAELLKATSDLIGFDSEAKGLLKYLEDAIPEDEMRFFFDDFNHPRVQKAITLFKKHHPQYGNATPSFHELMDWLLKRSGILHASNLEQNMGEIFEIVMSAGAIDMDKDVCFTGADTLRLRYLSAPADFSEVKAEEE
jgi:hypothetical protein